MTELEQKIEIARLVPKLLTLYNTTNEAAICWRDTDEPVTEREWPYILLEAEKTLVPYPARDEIHYISNLTKIVNSKETDSRIEALKITSASYRDRMAALLCAICKWKD